MKKIKSFAIIDWPYALQKIERLKKEKKFDYNNNSENYFHIIIHIGDSYSYSHKSTTII